MENHPFLIGDTCANGGFSIAMLVYRSVGGRYMSVEFRYFCLMLPTTYQHLPKHAKTLKPVTEHSRLLPVVVPWDKTTHCRATGAVSNLKTHGESPEEKVVV